MRIRPGTRRPALSLFARSRASDMKAVVTFAGLRPLPLRVVSWLFAQSHIFSRSLLGIGEGRLMVAGMASAMDHARTSSSVSAPAMWISFVVAKVVRAPIALLALEKISPMGRAAVAGIEHGETGAACGGDRAVQEPGRDIGNASDLNNSCMELRSPHPRDANCCRKSMNLPRAQDAVAVAKMKGSEVRAASDRSSTPDVPLIAAGIKGD